MNGTVTNQEGNRIGIVYKEKNEKLEKYLLGL